MTAQHDLDSRVSGTDRESWLLTQDQKYCHYECNYSVGSDEQLRSTRGKVTQLSSIELLSVFVYITVTGEGPYVKIIANITILLRIPQALEIYHFQW